MSSFCCSENGRFGKRMSVKFPGWLVLFFFAASLVAMACSLRAQEPSASPTPSVSGPATASQSAGEGEEMKKEVYFPSPDGKFTFLVGRGEYQQTIDLIDKKTEKVLQHIADDDMSSVYYTVLWAPDSKRFALMTRVGHPNQGVSVYAQSGDTFHEIELPDLPEAKIPEKLKHGKRFPHVSTNNWQEAEEWRKDGSLVVTINTTIDGAGDSVSAERTVVLGFDRSGKAKVLKSTIKYESEKN
jgi:hypothetical protein